MAQSTEEDLFDAVKDSMYKEGILGKFKAELRASVMSILNKSSSVDQPKIPEETKFLNELVREYLSWNGYVYTEQILAAESGQNAERQSRDILTTKLGVVDDTKTKKIPLLYYIVEAFKNSDDD